MDQRVVRRVVVRGRVQGVGFREWTRHVALDRGVEGWVRNRADGSVEAVFAAEIEVVVRMVAACRKGPMHARVESVDESEAAPADLDLRRGDESFSVLPSR
jgi:acylphosphatase